MLNPFQNEPQIFSLDYHLHQMEIYFSFVQNKKELPHKQRNKDPFPFSRRKTPLSLQQL